MGFKPRTIATRLPANTLPKLRAPHTVRPATPSAGELRQVPLAGNPLWRNRRFSPSVESLDQGSSYPKKGGQ